MSSSRACAECLRRAWLLVRLAGHLDNERERIAELLDRADEDLIEAVGGSRAAEVRAEWEAFDAGATSPSMAGPSKRGSGFFGAGAGGTVTA